MNTCLVCHGNTKYYSGLLGYESYVCTTCQTHYTVGNQVWLRGSIMLTKEQVSDLEKMFKVDMALEEHLKKLKMV